MDDTHLRILQRLHVSTTMGGGAGGSLQLALPKVKNGGEHRLPTILPYTMRTRGTASVVCTFNLIKSAKC